VSWCSAGCRRISSLLEFVVVLCVCDLISANVVPGKNDVWKWSIYSVFTENKIINIIQHNITLRYNICNV
jgi:hypothetical protein